MQEIESRLSIISKTLKNESLNSFELNLNLKEKQTFKAIKDKSDNTDHELNFLINSWKLYSLICPSLSSHLLFKIANLTSEIRQSKTYDDFFSGKICPKCFSTYFVGINCQLFVKSIRGKIKHKIKNTLKKVHKLSDEQVKNYNFKRIEIKCKLCKFIYNKIFWDKKRRRNVQEDHISKKSLEVNSNSNMSEILKYSNYIVQSTNLNSDNNQILNKEKKSCKISSNLHNTRFFSKNDSKAGIKVVKNNCDIPNQEIKYTIKKETKTDSTSSNSFYDILSKLG